MKNNDGNCLRAGSRLGDGTLLLHTQYKSSDINYHSTGRNSSENNMVLSMIRAAL